MSLLIAVLGDTCDRVMLTREEESIRNRAAFAAKESNPERIEKRDEMHFVQYVFLLVVDIVEALVFFPFLALYAILFSLLVRCGCAFSQEKLDYVERRYGFIWGRELFPRRLGYVGDGSSVLILRFLVPETAVTFRTRSFWQGRLDALSNLIAGKLNKSEEQLNRDMKALGRRLSNIDIAQHQQEQRISNLESTIHQHMQQTQNGFRKIEQMLETLVPSTPQASLGSPSGE